MLLVFFFASLRITRNCMTIENMLSKNLDLEFFSNFQIFRCEHSVWHPGTSDDSSVPQLEAGLQVQPHQLQPGKLRSVSRHPDGHRAQWTPRSHRN